MDKRLRILGRPLVAILRNLNIITCYNKKQLTLACQEQDGPLLKDKLVQDKPGTIADSPNRSTSHNENQQAINVGADPGPEAGRS